MAGTATATPPEYMFVNMFLIRYGSYITVGSLTIKLIFFSPNLMQCSHNPAVSEVHLVFTSVSQYTLSDERKQRFAY